MNAPCLKIGSLPIPSLPSRCLRSSRGLSAASSPINILKQIPALPPHPAMNVCTEYTQGFLFPALAETGWAVEPRVVANWSSCLRFQSPGIAALCRHGELAQVYVNEHGSLPLLHQVRPLLLAPETRSQLACFLKIIFIYMYSCLPAWMYVYRMCARWPQRPEECIAELESQTVVSLHVDAGNRTWVLQERQVLLTVEPSLQPLQLIDSRIWS